MEFEQVQRSEEEESRDCPQNVKEDLTGYHFLLVEDKEINSEILGELLQMRGATFVVKKDGQQAVDEFKQAKPVDMQLLYSTISTLLQKRKEEHYEHL